MRENLDRERLRRVMAALGRASQAACRIDFTGGATAVDLGWRSSTLDVDLRLEPDSGSLLREFPRLKNELRTNLELASPLDFLPPLPGWRDRGLFIARESRVDFFHFDPYSQVLAKLERGHRQDLADVEEFFARGLVAPDQLWQLFLEIEPELYRFPAVDAASFRASVEATVQRRLGSAAESAGT